MTDKEQYYIQKWVLTLLTRFMLDSTPISISKYQLAIKEDTPQYSEYNSLVQVLNNYRVNDNFIFNVEKISSDRFNLSSALDENEIKKLLKNYLRAYKKDDVIDSTNDKPLPYKIELQNFNDSIDYNLKLKNYKFDNNQYLPIILMKFLNEEIDIQRFNVNFPLKEKYGDEEFSIIKEFYDCDWEFPILKDNFLDVEIIADITSLRRNDNLKSKNNVSKEISFKNEEIRIINEAIKLKEHGRIYIEILQLENFLRDKLKNNKGQNPEVTISKAISDLNSKFEKKNGKKLFGRKTKKNDREIYPII